MRMTVKGTKASMSRAVRRSAITSRGFSDAPGHKLLQRKAVSGLSVMQHVPCTPESAGPFNAVPDGLSLCMTSQAGLRDACC